MKLSTILHAAILLVVGMWTVCILIPMVWLREMTVALGPALMRQAMEICGRDLVPPNLVQL